MTRKITHNNVNHNISVYDYDNVVAHIYVAHINNSAINVSLALNINITKYGFTSVSHVAASYPKWQL